MRFRSFIWDQSNIAHIAEHQVLPEEAEEACFNNPLVLKSRMQRYYVLGQTNDGRYIIVIISPKLHGKVRVVTAREMTDTERQRFLKR